MNEDYFEYLFPKKNSKGEQNKNKKLNAKVRKTH